MRDIAGNPDFRHEVRAFLAGNLSDEIRARVLAGYSLSKEETMHWHRVLFQKGWVAPTWPREIGGPGWDARQRYIFDEECHLAGAPPLLAMGLIVVGPIIAGAGSPEQREHFLPRILSGDDIWCQGFSEPGSGSDLASLSCKAVRAGGQYVVSGTKIWTTQAHWANWCLLLVRTASGAREQEGISILMLDMTTPGITVRPIITLDGEHVVNQLFFDDVLVPIDNRLGKEGDGWRLLRANIGHERILNAAIGPTKALLARIRDTARRVMRDGRPMAVSRRFMDKIVLLEVRLRALEATALELVAKPDAAERPEASMLKVSGTELQQDATRLLSEICGVDGIVARRGIGDDDDLASISPDYARMPTPNYLFLRKASISAGTNEVQRDVIARSLLSGVKPVALLADEQQMLADMSQRLAEKYMPSPGPPAGSRYADGEFWKQLAELGLTGILAPEELGGTAANATAVIAVTSGLGRHLATEPYIPSAIQGRWLLGKSWKYKSELQNLITGHLKLGVQSEAAGVTVEGKALDSRCLLSGFVPHMLGGDDAHAYLVTAVFEAGGLALVRVPRNRDGVTIKPFKLIDGRGAARLELDSVPVNDDDIVAEGAEAQRLVDEALDLGTIALLGEATGAADSIIAATIDHLRTRHQFGRPLADFQVLRHRLADMYTAAEELRYLVFAAAAAFDRGEVAERIEAVSSAKIYFNTKVVWLAEQGVQLHGAMGVTEECVAGRHLKQVTTIARLFGDVDYHLDRLHTLTSSTIGSVQ